MALLTAAGIGFVLGAIVGFIFQATVMYVVNPVTALVGTGLMFGGTGALASLGHVLITERVPRWLRMSQQRSSGRPGDHPARAEPMALLTAVVVGGLIGAVIGLVFLAATFPGQAETADFIVITSMFSVTGAGSSLGHVLITKYVYRWLTKNTRQ